MQPKRFTQKETIFAIIEASKGNPLSLADIYHALEAHPIVTPYHREPWKKGGQPRFECWARRRLTTLVREKRIKKVASGTYSIG